MRRTKITPCLWFEYSAKEAVEFYCETFRNSFIIESSELSVKFSLNNIEFVALNKSPNSTINDTISFSVYCGGEWEIERLYSVFSQGGEVIMPLGPYPFARKYAWVKDKFGVSWQLDVDPINNPQNIVPSVMFVNDHAPKLKEAINFYHGIFPKPMMLFEVAYPPEIHMPEGCLRFAQHKLNGYIFNFMSNHERQESESNESVSFTVWCKDQEDINHYWNALNSKASKIGKFGWLQDKYGLWWQILPNNLGALLKDKENLQKLMQMEKINLADLNT
jgi:predicted 3-demethylubiquinone-9 3-methyltransferase (glyoxalase superfamily)